MIQFVYDTIFDGKLIHTSKEEILQLKNTKQFHLPSHKPDGFWYSYENRWLKWCKHEMPHWIGNFAYEVYVSKVNLLKIRTPEMLTNFENTFYLEVGIFKAILWEEVSKYFDGIEFIDENKDLVHHRWIDDEKYPMKGRWFNCYDVPSGCIWNTEKLVIRKINFNKFRIHKKKSNAEKIFDKIFFY